DPSMDPITQSALGAALAQSVARPTDLRRAGLAGALGGFLPDADVLIRSSSDPLLFLDYHRQFTHSFVFIPIGGALTAALCVLLLRGKVQFRQLLLPATLGWASHGLLDACTSYGTFLYWPFDLQRVAWHVISIIDPLFTVGLVLGVVLAIRRSSMRPARAALVFALAYLTLCSFQLGRAQEVQDGLVMERGHEALRSEVKPSLGNNMLFRSFYESEGRFYVDAIRVPWIGSTRVYPGESCPTFSLDDFQARHALSELHIEDIQRFRTFSADFVVEDPRHQGVLSDFRYAAVPNAIAPLWGVDVLATPPDEHLAFRQFHDIGAADRKRFFGMLQGKESP
ncbi:MAG: metal-dependent hydrolase, partial [Myxococcota bacterium]|nr:metal-dependent hydrolase [Myxococcota bacterium]